MTRLVLTNAVYFKGKWAHPFDKDMTQPAPFFLSPDKKVEVPLMHQKLHCAFGTGQLAGQQGFKVLELPYQAEELSLVVLLPDAVDGLAVLEKELTPQNLKQWTAGLGHPEVRIWLPK